MSERQTGEWGDVGVLTGAPAPGPARVLVVDDDDVDRTAVVRALAEGPAVSGSAPVETSEAGDAAGARAALASTAFDCVVLDYHLPDADGLELIEEIRAAGSRTPIVVLTGHGDQETAVALMRAGATDYLPKTALASDRIARSVDAALRLAAARREAECAERERERLLRDTEAANRELVRLAAQAEMATRAKSEFLATMSHELRTPVNAIIGYAQLMEMGLAGPLSEGQRRYLDRIKATSAHLTNVVSEVLDLTKAEAGQLDVTPAPARAGDAVSAAIALVAPQAAARGVALADRCNGAAELTYIGDDVRVRQILANLLSNAVKFTPTGGEVVVRCEVADRPAPESPLSGGGPWAAFRVRDTGIGIPPDKLEHIFEPFVQLDAGHTRKEGGTGLGLTISRRLARLMGGDLTVESAPGGSTFTLWLPATAGTRTEVTPISRTGGAARGGLAEIGVRLSRQAEDVASALAQRLWADPATPEARALSATQLKDHLATFVTDLGKSLIILAEHHGEPSRAMRDGTEIQRLIAERHGAQRAGLGWTEAAHRREHEILREEVEAAVRRTARGDDPDVAEALGLLRLFVEQAERVSLHGMRAATGRATS